MKLFCTRCKREVMVRAVEITNSGRCYEKGPHVHCTVCQLVLYLPMGERAEGC
jgi:hypothetical protein